MQLDNNNKLSIKDVIYSVRPHNIMLNGTSVRKMKK